MSSPEQQVERLNALLAKVQKNRRRPVGLAPMAALGTSTPANTTGAAAVASRFAPPQPPAASPTRARKLTPAEPITAAVAAPPTPVREEMPEKMPEAPRRPAPPAARPVSPLENALSGEVEREERAAAPRAPAVEAPMRTGTAPRSQRPPAPAPEVMAASTQQPIVPRVIEPDPPRTSTRPIAQVVSKHAPVVDATFGAMLKRSLSLRPH